MLILVLCSVPLRSQTFPMHLIDGKLHIEMMTDGIPSKVPVVFSRFDAGLKMHGLKLESDRTNEKVIGINHLSKFPQPILFDFEHMQMVAGFTESEGFVSLDAKIAGMVQLSLPVRWKRYKFRMSPDLPVIANLRSDKKMKFLSGHSFGESNGRFYSGIGIGIGTRDYGPGLTICQTCHNEIGSAFMAGFNWIVDFRAGNVSAKKNSRIIEIQGLFGSK